MKNKLTCFFDYFVSVDALRPDQHFSIMSGYFPGFNQYLEKDRVSFSWTQHSASGKIRARDPSISSQSFYH